MKRMTPALDALVKKAELDYKNGKNISPVFSAPKEMLAYLHSA